MENTLRSTQRLLPESRPHSAIRQCFRLQRCQPGRCHVPCEHIHGQLNRWATMTTHLGREIAKSKHRFKKVKSQKSRSKIKRRRNIEINTASFSIIHPSIVAICQTPCLAAWFLERCTDRNKPLANSRREKQGCLAGGPFVSVGTLWGMN